MPLVSSFIVANGVVGDNFDWLEYVDGYQVVFEKPTTQEQLWSLIEIYRKSLEYYHRCPYVGLKVSVDENAVLTSRKFIKLLSLYISTKLRLEENDVKDLPLLTIHNLKP